MEFSGNQPWILLQKNNLLKYTFSPEIINTVLTSTTPYSSVSPMKKTLYCKGITHCIENPIYVFPEKEMRGLSPNFRIHVSVSDLYIPRIGPHIFLQQNRQTNLGNTVYKSLTDT
jgi:hypothetical protein